LKKQSQGARKETGNETGVSRPGGERPADIGVYRTGIRFQGTMPVPPGEPLWVFAYGSLLWNPGFAFEEAVHGKLRGYHRRFCVRSTHYRGDVEAPGLVLGLDEGGACEGLVYRVRPEAVEETVAYLYEREMIGDVYRPMLLPVLAARHGTLRAYTFVVRPETPDYCNLPDADCAAIIAAARGLAGSNVDYLANTVRHLEELGLPDQSLHDMLTLVRRHQTS
jgi:glutathione-specific gamma-glutamylcyclotransferase